MSQQTMRAVAGLYGIEPEQVEPLGAWHNRVFRARVESPFILRLTDALRRTDSEIRAEVEFLRYLAAAGAAVAAPLPAQDGLFLHSLREGETVWRVCAFEQALGYPWQERADDITVAAEIGQAIGRVHRLSQPYSATHATTPRRQWHQNSHLQVAKSLFQRHDARLLPWYEQWERAMHRLPRDNGSFGLVHGDYLFSNFQVDGRRITIYDFDDCEWNWFVYDLAVNLYYYLLAGRPLQVFLRGDLACEYVRLFLRGYRQEMYLDDYWLQQLPLFLQLREFNLVSTIYEHKEKTGSISPWQQAVIDTCHQHLGKPLLDPPLNE